MFKQKSVNLIAVRLFAADQSRSARPGLKKRCRDDLQRFTVADPNDRRKRVGAGFDTIVQDMIADFVRIYGARFKDAKGQTTRVDAQASIRSFLRMDWNRPLMLGLVFAAAAFRQKWILASPVSPRRRLEQRVTGQIQAP
jgi:hypothetical protein